MKKTYLRPEFEISVFESKNEISARGDWELNISRGKLDSYGDPYDILDQGDYGDGDFVDYGASNNNVSFGFGWNW